MHDSLTWKRIFPPFGERLVFSYQIHCVDVPYTGIAKASGTNKIDYSSMLKERDNFRGQQHSLVTDLGVEWRVKSSVRLEKLHVCRKILIYNLGKKNIRDNFVKRLLFLAIRTKIKTVAKWIAVLRLPSLPSCFLLNQNSIKWKLEGRLCPGLMMSHHRVNYQIDGIIIRCVFSSLSIGRESTTWPASNCLQIMVCSCVVPSKRGLLQIIFCSCVMGTTFSGEKWQIASLSCQEVIKIWKQSWWSNDKTIIELGYHKISWFVSVSQLICSPLTNHDILLNLVQ